MTGQKDFAQNFEMLLINTYLICSEGNVKKQVVSLFIFYLQWFYWMSLIQSEFIEIIGCLKKLLGIFFARQLLPRYCSN